MKDILAKYKWFNFVVAILGVSGVAILTEAKSFPLFAQHPALYAILGVVVGLFTKFYRANQAEIDKSILD